MSTTNPYCEALAIPVPRLEMAKERADANYYSLLIVTLLERGEPITLEEAARRFEAAGIAPPGRALASLKRSKPARPPIYPRRPPSPPHPLSAHIALLSFPPP